MHDARYLQVEQIWKTFGAFVALRDVSFDVGRGEFVCLLGPSGCGKTTLLRIIMGLEVQTRGRVLREGRDISGLPPARRDFGIVFQSYALFPNLTVFDNVGYGLQGRGLTRAQIRARVEELLALVGLQGERTKYPAQLSGGQQQRVALARALAPSPSLLLLDEPLSALDARLRVRLRHEVRHLQRQLGVTTILVTHDQEEALTMADRIAVMNHGVIEQIGTPMDVYQHPATSFVADFVGEMNFLRGTLLRPDRVRVGATELTCAPADGLSAGSPVRVCFRPEDVDVRGARTGAPNTIAAEVVAVDFLGSFYRATLRPAAADAAALRADVPAHLHREVNLAPGRTLTVSVPADRVRVFPGD
ncbi:MAG: putative 2-aminoethylphosphonate ABC transporter ATP-binding protein [Armatimonadota bacterium]|nr:putative 2-aminoethylphosphonate ABC transporter ATP-binding protein [Armatimonadota bacterium]MDR7487129.1 putative 2-aminoethylphosphonate ABC transporter ATP-binding protein [Armatimonadota bacterium]MDR7534587.1 putative 2-aminoethylphosphonate ABC transporter ATP-binding protein [Armatimonadota bacterium]MDR7535027.1 putative 2-aminoethylphosphonate ABC transporter ATP-binding protein [Armatimonadota bacterium]